VGNPTYIDAWLAHAAAGWRYESGSRFRGAAPLLASAKSPAAASTVDAKSDAAT
jgi:hypothetical protein